MSNLSLVMLLMTAFWGIGLLGALRMPPDWEAPEYWFNRWLYRVVSQFEHAGR